MPDQNEAMILSVDVDYRKTRAFIAGITFCAWDDEKEKGIIKSILDNYKDYLPGQFYRRELPCILQLIEEHEIEPETIVIDGFVFLDGKYEPGLGKHLYEALNGRVAVVGVAKRPFKGIPPECELLRGKSRKPLYITSVGMPLEIAKNSIKSMYGKYRVPALLRKTDQVCRQS
jgi:deoxyribonuclease V